MLIASRQSLLYQLRAERSWIGRLLTWISASGKKSLCPINISSLLASSGSGEGQILPSETLRAHRAQPRNKGRIIYIGDRLTSFRSFVQVIAKVILTVFTTLMSFKASDTDIHLYGCSSYKPRNLKHSHAFSKSSCPPPQLSHWKQDGGFILFSQAFLFV